jgi:hypothetical protein
LLDDAIRLAKVAGAADLQADLGISDEMIRAGETIAGAAAIGYLTRT